MKAKDLLTIWSAPDNSRLTSKQFSFRLPVHVAAKVAALCEMYPHKSRTQIVADLLSSALADLERAFPKIEGRDAEPNFEDQVVLVEDIGPGNTFRRLANKHFEEIEREMGTTDPKPLYEQPDVWIVQEMDP